jgi:hypothetical protein
VPVFLCIVRKIACLKYFWYTQEGHFGEEKTLVPGVFQKGSFRRMKTRWRLLHGNSGKKQGKR